jgi:hypothetical protein
MKINAVFIEKNFNILYLAMQILSDGNGYSTQFSNENVTWSVTYLSILLHMQI